MVDPKRVSNVEHDRRSTATTGGDVDGGGVVPDHIQVRGDVGHQGVVEPGQVLAHQASGEVVGRGDWSTGVGNAAFVRRPPVPLVDGPFIETGGVRRRLVLVAVERHVQRQLATWIVEHEVIGLRRGVGPATECAGFDHVDPNLYRRTASLRHGLFQYTQAPGTQPDD